MPGWVQAGGWGLLAGSALVLGAAVGYLAPLPQRLVAGVMAVGAGVLISALSFDLMAEAEAQGGVVPAVLGFALGAVVYSVANLLLARFGARHRKRSGPMQAEDGVSGSSIAIALGALIDGIPESIAIGISLLSGRGVSVVAVCAVFLSNVPEGLSSAAGMRRAGRSGGYVFGVWGAIALASGIAAVLGYVGFQGASPATMASITAVAAGAILAMLADTMMPEASHGSHELTGLLTVLGFLAAFALGHSQ